MVKGNEAKAVLVAEGKTPEEIQESLWVTFKYEGDKLKYFINALDVAAKNATDLVRVMIMRLNEGESAQGKGVQVEDLYYLPEFRIVVDPNAGKKQDAKGGRGKGGKGRQGRGGGQGMELKESPWGLSPEQKAAKRASEKSAAAARKV